MKTALIILAAGKGTRMNSDLPKVLHPLAGEPMLLHALAAGETLDPAARVVVAGHGAEEVREDGESRGSCSGHPYTGTTPSCRLQSQPVKHTRYYTRTVIDHFRNPRNLRSMAAVLPLKSRSQSISP